VGACQAEGMETDRRCQVREGQGSGGKPQPETRKGMNLGRSRSGNSRNNVKGVTAKVGGSAIKIKKEACLN